jgi:opacity protein-like surface antigen
MKEKAKIMSLTTICLSILVLIMTSAVCSAQEWNRMGRGEFFVLGQQMNGDTTTGLGLQLGVDDTVAGGLGIGFNFQEYLNMNMDMYFGNTDLTASGYGFTFREDSDVFGMDFNIDCNFLKSRFSPLISGGIGFINFHDDRGYDFNETDFSYNLGVGFRFDVTDNFLVKGIYKFTWTELEGTADPILLDGVSLSMGFIF